MCDDHARPTLFELEYRKANKEHKCCECNAIISKGELYGDISGLWDGEFSHYKQCFSCSNLFQLLNNKGHCLTFGGLIQELYDSGVIYPDPDEDDCMISEYSFIVFDDYDTPRYKAI